VSYKTAHQLQKLTNHCEIVDLARR